MDLDKVHNVYFLGIGGIGMSALARYFLAEGKKVAGYDLTSSPVTDELSALGADIHFSEGEAQIPGAFRHKSETWVIRTPAVPEHHEELRFFRQNAFPISKRSEVLGMLFNKHRGMAVAGTHGKTSVSCMLASIMHGSELGCTAFLGGILKNTDSNFILDRDSQWVVTEADEFDRSFLMLRPEISLVTWLDADHLDIYGSKQAIEQAFHEYIGQTKENGVVILKEGIPLGADAEKYRAYTYSLDRNNADFYAAAMKAEEGCFGFDLVTPGERISGIRLKVIGRTNVENAVAAASMAWAAGVPDESIRTALAGFEGVRRRFDIQFRSEKRMYIDDYAHHPRELDALIGSVRQLFPNRKITGIFQPHLYSRTRDFALEFARSLSALDELILLDIYPAREEPLPGVSSAMILDRVNLNTKELCKKEDLPERLAERDLEILITAGAGDIDRLVIPLRKMMESL